LKEKDDPFPFPSKTFARLFFWRYMQAAELSNSVFADLLAILKAEDFEKEDVPSIDQMKNFFRSKQVPFIHPTKAQTEKGAYWMIPPEAYAAFRLATPGVSEELVRPPSKDLSTISTFQSGTKFLRSQFFRPKGFPANGQIFQLQEIAMHTLGQLIQIQSFSSEVPLFFFPSSFLSCWLSWFFHARTVEHLQQDTKLLA